MTNSKFTINEVLILINLLGGVEAYRSWPLQVCYMNQRRTATEGAGVVTLPLSHVATLVANVNKGVWLG